MDRRQFLGTTAAALASGPLSLAASESAQPSPKDNHSPGAQCKALPIGVFNPPFRNLSLDQMLAKFPAWGIFASCPPLRSTAIFRDQQYRSGYTRAGPFHAWHVNTLGLCKVRVAFNAKPLYFLASALRHE